ncbi:hypothetical protein [Desulfoluna sp.]|uniref:toxin-antitoxin system YwqK family antitoxin n=1 Tax=Desulfoluna sp. TaxID=2045199 RepID=UPI0026276E21|nr:hypothetical protein [Desulfoluna sp.]
MTEKKYHEGEFYIDKQVHFDIQTKKPINGVIIRTFKGTEIIRSKWPYKNGKIHGKAYNYRKSKALLSESHFKMGQRHGLVTFYTQSGAIAVITSYYNNQFDGLQKFYFGDGSLRKEQKYSKGILLIEKEHFKAGSLKKQTKFKNSKLIEKMTYSKEGKRQKSIFYNPDKSEIWVKDYSHTGEIDREYLYIDKIKKSEKHYDFFGKLTNEYTYQDDEGNGTRTYYTKSGEIKTSPIKRNKSAMYFKG